MNDTKLPICSSSTSECVPLLGFKDLKEHIHITQDQVECPVFECPEKVKRQRKHFKCEDVFKCPRHHICISPTTFEYPNETYNILNRSTHEMDLLSMAKKYKRESRIAHDNSEDALTWNAFRFLHHSNLLLPWLKGISGYDDDIQDEIYWSYSLNQKVQWDILNRARTEFGEEIKNGSEPDLAIVTNRCVFFVEAKLTATNQTSGKGKKLDKHLNNPKAYVTGDKGWFKEIFKSDYPSIINDQKYELMRFWLLGSWMAKQMAKDFILVNLVCDPNETTIQADFGKHIQETGQRRFIRQTWEDIYRLIKGSGISTDQGKAFLNYMENKTIGYDSDGNLRKAFNI